MLVGIIANPSSGKDIRRVVARGIGVPDHEKINIVRRMLVGLAALGVRSIRWMPDAANLVDRAADGLSLPRDARALQQPITDTADDTINAAAALRERGAACIIVLGGDGTCRAVTKGAGDTPILPVSTGTNNAFPQFVEGTLAGLAAAVVARYPDDPQVVEQAIVQMPVLRILREGEPIDLALVDVVSFEGMIGARAVWQMERVRQLVSVRHTPGTIGLSAVAGFLGLQPPDESAALALWLDPNRQDQGAQRVLAPVSPGVIEEIAVRKHRWLDDGGRVRVDHAPCVLALDGERDFAVRNGMLVDVQLDRRGPRVVQVQRALELGVQRGLFDPSKLEDSGDAKVGITSI